MRAYKIISMVIYFSASAGLLFIGVRHLAWWNRYPRAKLRKVRTAACFIGMFVTLWVGVWCCLYWR